MVALNVLSGLEQVIVSVNEKRGTEKTIGGGHEPRSPKGGNAKACRLYAPAHNPTILD